MLAQPSRRRDSPKSLKRGWVPLPRFEKAVEDWCSAIGTRRQATLQEQSLESQRGQEWWDLRCQQQDRQTCLRLPHKVQVLRLCLRLILRKTKMNMDQGDETLHLRLWRGFLH